MRGARTVRRTAAAVIAMAVLLTACGSSESPTAEAAALTQEQAELFATTRFLNFDAGVRAVNVTIAPQTGQDASTGGSVTGWVDFAEHLGYASVDQGSEAQGLLLWSGERIAVNESVTGAAKLPVPARGWRSAELVAATSSLTQSLAIVTNLASDRPENPLLLRQSDAAYLREDTVDGQSVVVLAGPSPSGTSTADTAATPEATPLGDRVRYWINQDGLLLRVQAKLTGTSEWTVFDFSAAEGIDLDTSKITTLLR